MDELIKWFPGPLFSVILSDDQELPTNYISVFVLHFTTVGDTSIAVYTNRKVKSFQL